MMHVTTIDAFVLNAKAPNYIKIDIDNELNILEGGRETIAKHLPTLVVSIYHNPNDFILITEKILSISDKYRFLLKHCSDSDKDIFLFAVANDPNIKTELSVKPTVSCLSINTYTSKMDKLQQNLITRYRLSMILKLNNINESIHRIIKIADLDIKGFPDYFTFDLSQIVSTGHNYNIAYIKKHFPLDIEQSSSLDNVFKVTWNQMPDKIFNNQSTHEFVISNLPELLLLLQRLVNESLEKIN
jgi:hypothetical protein